jgi:threonine dehydrogenase-like Zn-dependent dehydrogenase
MSASRTASSCRSARCSPNKGVRGGFAPARAYIPELLPDVLDGRINPGRVLDYATDLEGIADAYAAMDERRAIKSLVRVGSV